MLRQDMQALEAHLTATFIDRTHGDEGLSRFAELARGRTVLVTGAAGTIGRALVQTLLAMPDIAVVGLDNSEGGLFDLEQSFGDARLSVRLCDVRDAAGVDRVLAERRPGVVFHAAALKHQSFGESHRDEVVLTNLLGARTVLDACAAHAVADAVCISTDKAVHPTSAMGRTKRLQELMCQAAARTAGPGRAISVVRFGNVLGSSGSVVPILAEQAAAGRPMTVTDPEAIRYFMSREHAAHLLCGAAALARSGPERTFRLEMGSPRRILDLAHAIGDWVAANGGPRAEVVVTGLRVGEKLSEVLAYEFERETPTTIDGILRIDAPPVDAAAVNALVAELIDAARRHDGAEVAARLDALDFAAPDARAVA